MKSNKAKRFFTLQRKYLSIPYIVFLVLFILVPIGIVMFYAFTYEYTDPATGVKYISASGQAFLNFFTSWSKWNVLFVSLFIATLTTLLCLLIGFPLAYFLADKKVNKNAVFVTLFIAPMWINFVLRTGATRDLLTWIGINGGNHPYIATLIGMVQNYLPFVILPLYTTMLKLDKSQIEAAADLGANPFQVFVKTIIPMTIPGIVSAATMTFMPTMSSYVIANKMSENKTKIIGNIIEYWFGESAAINGQNIGSVLSLVMLMIIGISLLIQKAIDAKTDSRKVEIW